MTVCRVCGASEGFTAHLAREMMFGLGGSFRYLECRACDSLQIETIPADLGSYYGGGYYSMQPRSEPGMRTGLKAWLAHVYVQRQLRSPESLPSHLLRKVLPEPTEWSQFKNYLQDSGLRTFDDPILDVGCGSSPHRLAAFRRLGFRAVLGVDPFVDGDLEYEGVPVRKRSIQECEGRFAWIMFHHSLEHMPDPVDALRAAFNRLRPGGRCLVRVPVVGGWMWRRFGVDWVEFDAPRHLHLMSPQGLAAAASSAGFTVLRSFHESEGWEIAWSEAYRRGVTMSGERSGKIEEIFTSEVLRGFSARAQELNVLHIAGRAAFVLEKPE